MRFTDRVRLLIYSSFGFFIRFPVYWGWEPLLCVKADRDLRAQCLKKHQSQSEQRDHQGAY